MTPDLQKRLTWEDATERFLDVAELKAAERPGVLETAVDKLAWAAHNTLTGQLTPAGVLLLAQTLLLVAVFPRASWSNCVKCTELQFRRWWDQSRSSRSQYCKSPDPSMEVK